MLAKEIAYRWANKEILLHIELILLLLHIELILLVYLRDPRFQVIKSVKQLLQLYLSTNNITENVAGYLRKCRGNGVAFVLDGFDEYPVSLQCHSFIMDIINCKILPKAMMVVTSRPNTTLHLHHTVDRQVDILGFAKEEQEQCIIQSLKNYPERKVELCEYLKRQPTINNFCYVPLHLVILLYIVKVKGILFETLTEINELLIVHIICHYLEHSGCSLAVGINKLSELPTLVFNAVFKLSQIAFYGLQENKSMFTHDEIRKFHYDINDTPGAVDGFGLLLAVQHYSHKKAGMTISFSYLHYAMQEFLAAFHVSTLSDEEQSSLMKQTFWTENFSGMWMMYVGIVGVNSSPLATFVSNGEVQNGIKISDDILNDKRKCQHLSKCYAEAKVIVEELQVGSNYKQVVKG